MISITSSYVYDPGENSLPEDRKAVHLVYNDTVDFSEIMEKKCTQIYAVSFVQDTGKIIIVHVGKKNMWVLPGGGIEAGETFEEAARREVKEETNMEVLRYVPIGYQEVREPGKDPYYQLRCYCEVRPFGDFVEDPDGDITEIKLIDPADYPQYFDSGDIGEHIIMRAKEIHASQA